MKVKNYDMKGMRIALINLLANSLNKNSKFYKEDYDVMVSGVNKKTRKELIESLSRWNAVDALSQGEINTHCQL